MKRKNSKSAKIRKYLDDNPNASASEVSKKFKVHVSMVYALKRGKRGKTITIRATPREPVARPVSHPPTTNHQQVGGSHYKDMRVQPWVAMQAWMTPEQFAGFLRGNAIKYLARCDVKGGLEDVKKAHHYTAKLIEVSQ